MICGQKLCFSIQSRSWHKVWAVLTIGSTLEQPEQHSLLTYEELLKLDFQAPLCWLSLIFCTGFSTILSGFMNRKWHCNIHEPVWLPELRSDIRRLSCSGFVGLQFTLEKYTDEMIKGLVWVFSVRNQSLIMHLRRDGKRWTSTEPRLSTKGGKRNRDSWRGSSSKREMASDVSCAGTTKGDT